MTSYARFFLILNTNGRRQSASGRRLPARPQLPLLKLENAVNVIHAVVTVIVSHGNDSFALGLEFRQNISIKFDGMYFGKVIPR